jgi:hypothetical protein
MVRRRSLYARDVPVRTVRPILNVSDVRASLAWFETLGWETTFVWDDDHGEPGFLADGTSVIREGFWLEPTSRGSK